MKFCWLWLLGICLPLQATQTIYHWVDAKGVLHFADHPEPGQRPQVLELATPATPPPPSESIRAPSATAPEAGPAAPPQAPPPSYRISLLSPAPGATLRSNDGQVEIQAEVTPLPTPPYRLNLLLDGRLRASSQNTLSALLSNVDRGSHQLQVQLLAGDGKILASSSPVTFYLFRASRLGGPAAQASP